jgi:hypothetical protein
MLTLASNTKSKVKNTTTLSLKLGQKEIKRSIAVRFETKLLNEALDQLSPGLRAMLFQKTSTDPNSQKAKQQNVPGTDTISDSSLTTIAQKMVEFHWNEEQTGCKLLIDLGTGHPKSNIVLDSGTVKKIKVRPEEGGGVRLWFTFHADPTESMDATLLGKLHDLKDRDVYIQLAGPEVKQDELPTGSTVTPSQAWAGADAAAKGKNGAGAAKH